MKIHPALYEKLDEAYHNMVHKAEKFHWLLHGLESGYFEYDVDKVMQFFSNWLPDNLRSIDIEEACDFIHSHLNPTLEMDDVNYVVGIPQAINSYYTICLTNYAIARKLNLNKHEEWDESTMSKDQLMEYSLSKKRRAMLTRRFLMYGQSVLWVAMFYSNVVRRFPRPITW